MRHGGIEVDGIAFRKLVFVFSGAKLQDAGGFGQEPYQALSSEVSRLLAGE
jgi:hypothetical protein